MSMCVTFELFVVLKKFRRMLSSLILRRTSPSSRLILCNKSSSCLLGLGREGREAGGRVEVEVGWRRS